MQVHPELITVLWDEFAPELAAGIGSEVLRRGAVRTCEGLFRGLLEANDGTTRVTFDERGRMMLSQIFKREMREFVAAITGEEVST